MTSLREIAGMLESRLSLTWPRYRVLCIVRVKKEDHGIGLRQLNRPLAKSRCVGLM